MFGIRVVLWNFFKTYEVSRLPHQLPPPPPPPPPPDDPPLNPEENPELKVVGVTADCILRAKDE